MSIVRKVGTTDVSVVIRIVDSGDGTPETGVTSATAGLDLEYRREGAVSTDITEADLTNLNDAHSDGGLKHIGNGYYRLDLPDAACASGATGVLVHGTATGMVVIGEYVQLVAYDPFDTVRLGLTALPNAAADAAGGLVISDAGGFDVDNRAPSATSIGNMNIVFNTDFAANYNTTADKWNVSVTHWLGTAPATPTVAGVPEVDVTYTDGSPVSSGPVDANLVEVLGTAVTEGASGRLAGGIVKWFNVASPTGTVNSIPDAVAGASGGLLISGSNSGTTTFGALTVTGATTLTGAVSFGSTWGVTGAVTFTAGLASAITGNISGNLSGSVGSVTGAVGSVTGNVGGNVTGSVGSIAAGGIQASSFVSNAIDSSALATTAAAEIADAVWDEAIAGHLTGGSTGSALNAAGSAGDPWSTPLPGAYSAGTAGYILGTNLDGTISAVGAGVLAVLDDTGTSGVVVASGSKTGYALSASGLDLVVPADPSAIPVLGTASVVAWIGYFGAWSVNEVNSDADSVNLRNSADSADLAAHATSDTGSIFTSGEAT